MNKWGFRTSHEPRRSYTQKRLDEIRAARRTEGVVVQLTPTPQFKRSFRHTDETRRKYPEGTTEKPCTMCRKVKELVAYMPHKRGALGRHSVCNECRRAIAKEYTRKDREGRAGRPRPDKCDSCGLARSLRRLMHYDHDHKTGLFRGWVCHFCNVALGQVNDSIEHLEQLIAYLKRSGGPPKAGW